MGIKQLFAFNQDFSYKANMNNKKNKECLIDLIISDKVGI